MDVKITGINDTIRVLKDIAGRDLPYIISRSINETAKVVKEAEITEMHRIFDRPIPFTLNSLYIYPSTKTRLRGEVNVKDQAAKYILPNIEGGPRSMKRSERYLGSFYVPGKSARVNTYGNISPGQVMQILSVLKRAPDRYQNITAQSKRRNKKHRDYFAIYTKKGRLFPGVYERVRTGIKPILMFIKAPKYKKLFRFYEIGKEVVASNFEPIFNRVVKIVLGSKM
jgi:hypothetical protein